MIHHLTPPKKIKIKKQLQTIPYTPLAPVYSTHVFTRLQPGQSWPKSKRQRRERANSQDLKGWTAAHQIDQSVCGFQVVLPCFFWGGRENDPVPILALKEQGCYQTYFFHLCSCWTGYFWKVKRKTASYNRKYLYAHITPENWTRHHPHPNSAWIARRLFKESPAAGI